MARQKTIYLDNAATTPLDASVLKAMSPYFGTHYGNPSALYKEALVASKALREARQSIADCLRAQPDTIVFTSGGTEADNLAILGVARANKKKGKHIIVTAVEHHAVLHSAEALTKEGFEVTVVPVDAVGSVRAEEVLQAIRPDTILVSVMYANNEIGTIFPLADIGRGIVRYRKEKKTSLPLFHTDAAQAPQYLELDVEKLHVDLMTVNGGKIYGPKGTGFLYVRRGVALTPLMYGGSQERGVRAGTENIPGVVGLSVALELALKQRAKETKRLLQLTAYFWKTLSKKVPGVVMNGPSVGESRLPNNLNVIFPGVDGEALVIYLDSLGVACSTGSACTAVSREPSHVLKAIGRSEGEILSSVRFSLGRATTKSMIDATVVAITKALTLVTK